MVEFKIDEFPRKGVTVEGISKMRPAFKKDGTVTAANASGINDGAAAIVVMSAEKAKELGVKPMAKFVVGASAYRSGYRRYFCRKEPADSEVGFYTLL